MKIKVCGMKYKDNILEVAKLQPDYLGFIFYKNSARNFDKSIPSLNVDIKKVGVFVNSPIQFVLDKILEHRLNAVQLHGEETVDYCTQLKESLSEINSENIELIKVFSMDEEFNFDVLMPYEHCCDYFLFDTKGELPGGNGYAFNWEVLKKYTLEKPFFLSGGIGLESLLQLKEFTNSDASKYCEVIDVNSRLEIEPGLKNIEKLKQLKKELEKIDEY